MGREEVEDEKNRRLGKRGGRRVGAEATEVVESRIEGYNKKGGGAMSDMRRGLWR